MAANVYTIFEYAANKNWGGIDALDSRTRRAKGVAVQRRLLRDVCTLRDANGEVVPFEAFKGELVEGKLVDGIWVPDRRKVLRNDMKHTMTTKQRTKRAAPKSGSNWKWSPLH